MEIQQPSAHPTGVGSEFISYSRLRLLKEYLPRVQACINTLSEEDVWWRHQETDNSVGNLILHLTGNIGQWILAGLGGESVTRNRPLEFSERGPLPKADLLRRFEGVLTEADRVLAEFDPSKLLEVRHFQKWDVTCLYAISHVVEHVAQHMGQIIYITKLRTSQDLKFFKV